VTVKPVIPVGRAVQDVVHAVDDDLDEAAAPAAWGLIDVLQAVYRLIAGHPGIGSPRSG
jgi:toxin ParE1/3/4